MYGPGEPAEQVCRQGDPHPVPALLPAGIQLLLSEVAGPLPGPAHLQVSWAAWPWPWPCPGAGSVPGPLS